MASPEIEEIKSRLSIAEVVGAYVQLQKAGRNFRARCPFHKERTPSFMVSPERGTYMCFGCGEKGDVFSFFEKMEGVDFRAALVALADRAGVKLPTFSAQAPEAKAAQEAERERAMACSEAAAKFFEAALAARADVREYLASRAVSEATSKAWRVGFAPAAWDALAAHLRAQGFAGGDIVSAGLGIASNPQGPTLDSSSQRSDLGDLRVYDRFRGRVMFPIFDAAGRVIAFSGRFYEKVSGSREEGEPAKYVNSPETVLFKKSRILYGLNVAKETMRKADCILLVEGQFDVLLSHQSGLRFAVAVSGTALTDEHLALLERYSKRLVLALDADAAGLRSGMRSAAMALSRGFDVKIPRMPEGCKDPADAAARDPELLRAAVRESKTAIEFFLDALRREASDERAYKKAVEAGVLPLIAAIPSRIDQAHFIALVAGRLQVPEDAVRAEVARKPRLREPSEEPAQVLQQAAQATAFSRLESAVAMLIARPDLSEAIRGRLAALVAADRLEAIRLKSIPEAEALRFRFESIEAGEADVVEILFDTIAHEKVKEDIAAARGELRDAEAAGDTERQAAALARFQSLAKEKHAHKK